MKNLIQAESQNTPNLSAKQSESLSSPERQPGVMPDEDAFAYISSPLSGLSGGAWSMGSVMAFLAGAILSHQAELLQKVAPRIKQLEERTRFVEAILVAHGMHKSIRMEDGLPVVTFNYLHISVPGMAILRKVNLEELLYLVCDALYENRDLILKHTVGDGPWRSNTLELTEALALAEAVLSKDYRRPTELDALKPGHHSRLQTLASEAKLQIMLGLADTLGGAK